MKIMTSSIDYGRCENPQNVHNMIYKDIQIKQEFCFILYNLFIYLLYSLVENTSFT